MVASWRIAMCMAGLVASAAARPASITSWFGSMVDKAKDAMFPSAISGTLDASRYPDILYYAEYAAAAYCDPNHVPNTEIVCPNNVCPNVQKSTSYTVIEFAEGNADTTGIVAKDDTKKAIIIAFRGSHSVRNWMANLAAALIKVDWCPGCKVHKGFYNGYQEVAGRIRPTVKQLAEANPSYQIVTVGHSLGGALAQLTATDLRASGYKVTAYTFGSPRIGNDKLSTFISNAGTNYRVTHLNDPVPRVPLITLGYRHVSPEYHIFEGDTNIKPTSINVLDGILNFGGNTADDGIISTNVSAHRHYLVPGEISSCAGGFEFKRQ